MKDKRGILRGQCTQDGCDCMDFEADETQTICAYCGHFPPMHKNLSQQQVFAWKKTYHSINIIRALHPPLHPRILLAVLQVLHRLLQPNLGGKLVPL